MSQRNMQTDGLATLSAKSEIVGQYCLTGIRPHQTVNEELCWLLRLSDAFESIHVLCLPRYVIDQKPLCGSWVEVEVRKFQDAGRDRWACFRLSTLDAPSSDSHMFYRLPRVLCPLPEKFDDLLWLFDQVKTPALKQFISDVLLKGENTAIDFLCCPASLRYHHNFGGGLLAHSVEVGLMFCQQSHLTQEERELGIVAALFHDIGKIRTMTPDNVRTDLGRLVDHAHLTLEVCASALERLNVSDVGLANHLRHAWTCYSPNARFGFQPRTRVATLLQTFDRESAKQTQNVLPHNRHGYVTPGNSLTVKEFNKLN